MSWWKRRWARAVPRDLDHGEAAEDSSQSEITEIIEQADEVE